MTELFQKHLYEQPHPPSTINTALPPAVDAVILRALSKDPAHRYSSINIFAAELQAALSDNSTTKPAKGTIILGNVASPPETPSPIRPVPPSSFSTKVKKLLLAILVMLIIGSSAAIYFIGQGHFQAVASSNATATTDFLHSAHATQTARFQATTNANNRATATAIAQVTANAQATANAIAQATASAIAQANATASVLQTATSGQPIYQDALDNGNNSATRAAAWSINSFCKFQTDGYHVLATSSLQPQPCMELKQHYQNVTISVTMVVQSSFSSAGLLFHVQSSHSNPAYFFEVSPNQQQYKVSILNCKCQLLGWTNSASIHKGNAQNTLQVITVGDDFKFYINGSFLTDIQDTQYHYSNGGIGFACYDRSDLGEAVFSNLYVYPSS